LTKWRNFGTNGKPRVGDLTWQRAAIFLPANDAGIRRDQNDRAERDAIPREQARTNAADKAQQQLGGEKALMNERRSSR
jgi:hypothetical protein